MKTVKEVSRMTGLSIRALHHYDAIGLLPPSSTTAAGYRMYDDAALERLQLIMLLRELGWPLEQIRKMLDSPNLDRDRLLRQQMDLLERRREHLDALVELTRKLQAGGRSDLDFSAFDQSGVQAATGREGGLGEDGGDDASKTVRTCGEQGGCTAGVDAAFLARFAALGRLKSLPPDDAAVQRQVGLLRDYISANYYTCTPDVFANLGELYASGAFDDSIDTAGGAGTAAFAARAIEAYCRAFHTH